MNEGKMESQERTRLLACLVGEAAGDSLGMDAELMSLDNIRRKWPDGTAELGLNDDRVPGAVTDDTQMTLFTVEGMTRAKAEAAAAGCGPSLSDQVAQVHLALLRWLRTQKNPNGRPLLADGDSGIIKELCLWHEKAPGITCLASLEESRGIRKPARNNSKGCGTIMRVAPVALIADRSQVRPLAEMTSALTHGHPTGQLAPAAGAEMLADAADGADLRACPV